MAGYTRQSSAQILSGEIVSASPLNSEFNQVLAAFNESTGHKHDGTSAEGPPIDRIADSDQLNKVLVDTSNNHLEFYVQVSTSSVEQIKIQDGAIVPVTDNDIDLGATGTEFKDLYIDGTANIDSLVADTADINAGTIDGAAIGGTSASTGAFTTLSATGVVSISDGSASAPALTNTGDTNNGLYFNTADELTYTSGGTAQVTFKDGAIVPVTDNDIDLGATGTEFKDLHIDGTANIDSLVADTADIDGGTVDGAAIGGNSASSGAFTTLSATGVVSISDGSASAPALTNTGDTNNGLYFNAADELTYTSGGTAQVTFKDGAIIPVTDNDIDLGATGTEFKDLYIDGTAYLDSVNIAGGTITGVSTLADLGNAVPLTFSTTTTDSDPGTGNVRLNNSTQNAATQIYIDDADSNSVAIATFIQSLSAGNAPSATLGFVTLRKQFAPETFATYKVTAVTNATGYTKLTVANLAANTTNPFSDSDGVLLSIDLAGDKGDAGEMGGPATSTDNAVARYNGTGGSQVQNSGVTIDDSNNVSGVVGLTTTGDITVADDKYIVFGTTSDIKVGYDETTNDALQIGANVEGAALKIHYYADEADDDADNWLWQVADGGTMTWDSKISGSYATHLTLTPNSTASSSTLAAAGNLTVGGDITVTGGSISGITDLAVADGGTGQSSYTNGQLLIGNTSGNTLAKGTITAGDNISVTNGGGSITIAASGVHTQGLQTIWVPASAMRPTSSNGCAAITDVETTAGRPDMQVLDFDASSDEHAQFSVAFPKSWNAGTVTFQFFWTSTATDTDGVSFGLQGVSVVDGGTIDVAYGTAVVVDDVNQSTAEDLYVSPVSSAITIASAADDAMTFFRVFRDVSDANDTAAEDARLIGIKLYYTTDAGNDA